MMADQRVFVGLLPHQPHLKSALSMLCATVKTKVRKSSMGGVVCNERHLPRRAKVRRLWEFCTFGQVVLKPMHVQTLSCCAENKDASYAAAVPSFDASEANRSEKSPSIVCDTFNDCLTPYPQQHHHGWLQRDVPSS